MKESDVQRSIIEYLAYRKIFHYRQNSGAYKTERGGYVRFGTPGSPDIVCVVDGKYVGIECKRPGGRMSDTQIAFRKSLEGAGGYYILASCIEDVEGGLANLT